MNCGSGDRNALSGSLVQAAGEPGSSFSFCLVKCESSSLRRKGKKAAVTD